MAKEELPGTGMYAAAQASLARMIATAALIEFAGSISAPG
jgi:hypothetical protein